MSAVGRHDLSVDEKSRTQLRTGHQSGADLRAADHPVFSPVHSAVLRPASVSAVG